MITCVRSVLFVNLLKECPVDLHLLCDGVYSYYQSHYNIDQSYYSLWVQPYLFPINILASPLNILIDRLPRNIRFFNKEKETELKSEVNAYTKQPWEKLGEQKIILSTISREDTVHKKTIRR